MPNDDLRSEDGELAACFRCGGICEITCVKETWYGGGGQYLDTHFVICDCGVHSPWFSTKQEIIDWWNHRTLPPFTVLVEIPEPYRAGFCDDSKCYFWFPNSGGSESCTKQWMDSEGKVGPKCPRGKK